MANIMTNIKNRIKNFLKFLANSNIIISLGPVSLTYFTLSILSYYNTSFDIFLIPFFTSFFIYTFNRFTDVKEDKINIPERAKFIKSIKREFIILSIVSLILSLTLSYLHSLQTFLLILFPIILVIIYSSTYTRFKKLFLVKNIIVSLGWFLIPIYVGVYLWKFSKELIIISTYIFLRIFIGVLMFDIRDVIGDRINKINTIPIKLGVHLTKKIINILNISSLLLFIFSILIFSFPIKSIFPSILGFLFGVGYLIALDRKIDKKFLCDVIVDGEYICLGLILFIYDVLT